MRVHISDPALVDDLAEMLRHFGCSVEQDGDRSLEVCIPKSFSEDAAQLELDLYLAVWEATHDARARRVAAGAPQGRGGSVVSPAAHSARRRR